MSCLHHSVSKNRRAHTIDATYSRHADWWKDPSEQPREERSHSIYTTKSVGYRLPVRKKVNWSILYLSSSGEVLTNAEQKFRYYVAKWKEEIGSESSLTNITNNINYLRIIRIGDDAIPLILGELQRHPAPWFVALRAISEDDSVGRDSPGNFRAMAAAWIQWGKDNGHIK